MNPDEARLLASIMDEHDNWGPEDETWLPGVFEQLDAIAVKRESCRIAPKVPPPTTLCAGCIGGSSRGRAH
jgi:hypothetical protein